MTGEKRQGSSVWFEAVPDKNTYPPLSGVKYADVAVIGGGIAGITAAKALVEKGLQVILLEKNHIGTGDTGATTGFLLRMPDASPRAIAAAYGLDFLQNIFRASGFAKAAMLSYIERHHISCDFSLVNAYYGAYTKGDSAVEEECKYIKEAGLEAEFLADGGGTHFARAIKFNGEGMLHARKYIFGLLGSLPPKKFSAYEESEVISINASEEYAEIATQEGKVFAKKIIIAVGNPARLFPEFSDLLYPRLSYVIGVKYELLPISQNLFWDTLDPYFYYRPIGPYSLIIGGADAPAENAGRHAPFRILEKFLRERFQKDFIVTHQWSGSIFAASDGLPYAFAHPHYPNKIFIATGFNGNGLVLGTLAALEAASLALDEPSEFASLLSLSRTGFSVPMPALKPKESQKIKRFFQIAKTAEFEKSGMLCKTVEGKSIALFKFGEDYLAIDNTCSHAGGHLCEGTLDGKVVECPLHGAKFDITSGAVLGPPATRPQEKYPVRIAGDTVEIEIAISSADAHGLAASPPSKESRAGEKRPLEPLQDWKSFSLVVLGASVFWLAEFAFQYFLLAKGNAASSLIRSFALAGATLVSSALFSSAIFKWFPHTAVYWRLRRYLGVAGTVFVALHALSVYVFTYQFDFLNAYYTLNPFENPIVFGTFAFVILFVMASISTDWAVEKLTPRVWKFIHRFVYLAFVSAILHVFLISPSRLAHPPGYLLILITLAALFGQVYWFFKTAARRRFRSLGTFVGLSLIVLAVILGYMAYKVYYGW